MFHFVTLADITIFIVLLDLLSHAFPIKSRLDLVERFQEPFMGAIMKLPNYITNKRRVLGQINFLLKDQQSILNSPRTHCFTIVDQLYSPLKSWVSLDLLLDRLHPIWYWPGEGHNFPFMRRIFFSSRYGISHYIFFSSLLFDDKVKPHQLKK